MEKIKEIDPRFRYRDGGCVVQWCGGGWWCLVGSAGVSMGMCGFEVGWWNGGFEVS